jgi:hypothetical protein
MFLSQCRHYFLADYSNNRILDAQFQGRYYFGSKARHPRSDIPIEAASRLSIRLLYTSGSSVPR